MTRSMRLLIVLYALLLLQFFVASVAYGQVSDRTDVDVASWDMMPLRLVTPNTELIKKIDPKGRGEAFQEYGKDRGDLVPQWLIAIHVKMYNDGRPYCLHGARGESSGKAIADFTEIQCSWFNVIERTYDNAVMRKMEPKAVELDKLRNKK